MNDDLHFDDFVKKQFNGFSPNVPGHIWDKIAASRKSKPKGFWQSWFSGSNLLISTVVLLTVVTGYYLLSQNKTPDSSTKQNIAGAPQKIKPANDPVFSMNDEKEFRENNSTDNAQNNSASLKSRNTPAAKTFIFSYQPHQLTTGNSLKNVFMENEVEENQRKLNNPSPEQNANIYQRYLSPFTIINARELAGTKSILNKLKMPDCPTIEKSAAGNKKYWEVYAGPDYAITSYKTFNDTSSNNYLDKRKGSTRFSSAFSAGVRYTKVFSNGISVRAGLNYSQVNEKFNYFNPNEIKYITVITTRVVVRQPGDTLFINDTLQYQQTGTRTKTTTNRYRNIDVPLVFGYELGNGKIHANINAGIIINLYSWYKGDVLDTSYQPVSITTGKGNSIYQFKNNIGVGFLGGVTIYYNLSDKIHLLAEPYYRYNFSPMSKENLNLQQKYSTIGLRAGVRLDIQ